MIHQRRHPLPGWILVMGLLVPHIARADNWVRLPVTSVEGSEYFMDKDSLRRRGAFVRLWERLVLGRPGELPAVGPYRSFQVYVSYDCARHAAALLETRFYRDADSRELIDHHIRERPHYLYVAPGTPSQMKLDEACGLSQERPRR